MLARLGEWLVSLFARADDGVHARREPPCGAALATPRRSWRALERWPRALVELGALTFGGEAQLRKVVRETAPPLRLVSTDARGGGIACAWLLQYPGDNSLGRLGDDILANTTAGPYGVRHVRPELDRGGAIVDVGANLGAFSVVAARLHPFTQVVALEPTPTTCAPHH